MQIHTKCWESSLTKLRRDTDLMCGGSGKEIVELVQKCVKLLHESHNTVW